MILLLALATAQAMAPGASVMAQGAASPVALPGAESAGLSLTGALGLSERWSLELAGELGLAGSNQLNANLRPQLRIWAGSPNDAQQWAFFFGYGAAWTGGIRPFGAAGLSVDVGEGPWRLRVAGGPRLHGLKVEGLGLALGIARRPVMAAEAPPQAVATAPAEVAEAPEAPEILQRLEPEGARIWLPHPWCRWGVVEGGVARLPAAAQGSTAWATAEGYLPAPVLVGDGAPVQLKPIEAQGAGVAVVFPGDRLWAGEVEVPVGADGVAVLRGVEGPLTVRVVGGGRSRDVELSLSSGYGVWFRAPAPETLRIGFASGSDRLSAEGARRLAAFAQDAGHWSFDLSGGASPEGDPAANAALALRRARVCAAALQGAGMVAERLIVHEQPTLPDGAAATDPAGLRTCIVAPVFSPALAPSGAGATP